MCQRIIYPFHLAYEDLPAGIYIFLQRNEPVVSYPFTHEQTKKQRLTHQCSYRQDYYHKQYGVCFLFWLEISSLYMKNMFDFLFQVKGKTLQLWVVLVSSVVRHFFRWFKSLSALFCFSVKLWWCHLIYTSKLHDNYYQELPMNGKLVLILAWECFQQFYMHILKT